MKLKIKKLLCFFAALAIIASLLSACRGDEDVPTETLGEPNSEWQTVEPDDSIPRLSREELDALIQSVLGDEVWDGDFFALTDEQRTKIKAAMKARGYEVSVTDAGITYFSYAPVPEKSELDKLIQAALGDGVVWDGNYAALTKAQREAVQAALRAAGYNATVSEKGIAYDVSVAAIAKPKRYYDTPSQGAVEAAVLDVIGVEAIRKWDGKLSSLNPDVVDAVIEQFNNNGYNVGLDETGEAIVPLEKPPAEATTTAPAETTTETEEEPPENRPHLERTLLHTFGGSGADRFVATAVTTDGGFVGAVSTRSYNGDLSGMDPLWQMINGAIVKFDASGALEWKEYLGADGQYVAVSDIAVLTDGSVVVVGTANAKKIGSLHGDLSGWEPSAAIDAFIVKYSPDGQFQWIKAVKGSKDDQFVTVAATPDGDFIVGGKTNSYDGDFEGLTPGAISAFIIRYTADGNTVQWSRGFPGDRHSQIDKIAVTGDGSVYALCNTNSTSTLFFAGKAGFGGRDSVLMKLSVNGGLVWTKSLYGSGGENFTGLTVTSDGGCVVGGKFSANRLITGTFNAYHNYGGTDAALVKYDRDGNIGWITTLGGLGGDSIEQVIAVDGGYVAIGETTSTDRQFAEIGNKGEIDAFVALFSERGKLQRMDSLSGSALDHSLALIAFDGKTFMVAGGTQSSDGEFSGVRPQLGIKSMSGYFAKYRITD